MSFSKESTNSGYAAFIFAEHVLQVCYDEKNTMYQEIGRERLQRMQQIASRPQPDPNTPGNGRPRSQSMLLVGLIVFAVAGLLMGFTVGALNQPKSATQSNGDGNLGTKPTPTPTIAATPIPSIIDIKLGIPTIPGYQLNEKADGQTLYTFPIQVTDFAHQAFQAGNPLNVAGITCKLWLIPQIPDQSNYSIPIGALKDQASIQGSITGQFIGKNNGPVLNDTVKEVIPGFNFDTTTKQVQLSNSQGQTTWKYTVSPSLPPGTYYIIALVWGGKFYNFAWRQISVQKAG